MKTNIPVEALPKISGAEIAILQSTWHREYSDSMIRHCTELLQTADCGQTAHHELPGAMELPLAARTVARRNPRLEAIIVFGIVVRGETAHFDMIVDLCARGFERVMFEEDIPIIIELLPVESEKQAADRCGDDENNKGREAALAAAQVIHWRRSMGRNARTKL